MSINYSAKMVGLPHLFMKENILIVMPAYNAARTLKSVYTNIPPNTINSILLIDDGSTDTTVSLAKKLGIKTIVHKKNVGYGGNQKTCYREALKRGTTQVIMLHPDGQYDAKDLPLFVDALKKSKSDLILGSRFLEGRHKTPFYKSISIRFITALFNMVLGTHLTEANTGYRGFTRKFLETVPFHKNGNGYIFDPQMIIQAVYFGFRISEVPVSKDYNKEASSPNLQQSILHGFENLQLLVEYLLHIFHVKKADFLVK
ncbi:MAG: Glycosyl transferase, group 2 family protein [Microgenomates group bacterium GW2011_GWC1_41_8]|uniref:Glycosyl transferase, group 2 family protein n=3 Tax=Candidatus Roizmaniibacteriota TaxID=1752723 RepID=A0A0G0ZG49_9BACT|nr:MAG: Glycosyl transferase, group 2 family protein [Candidatus Roizmanbacteria bacterium GW2011_GWB1_40_7]KKS21021.1 MAG: Glycosyl transferase, group 2 family protein [Candidatus Roizmanbacteria bacterium GW2011_GWC2_41_7]KKS24388.1 MAG: Glycosyl transferase, group 2 family protein [Microgenomates group bacterium GW2011_GWC1_41_8]